MTWQSRVSNLAVGDTVAFKASFLRSTGQTTGDTPHMRGTVVELKMVSGKQLAKVDWGDGEGPKGALAVNLSKVTQRGIADE